MTTNRTRQAIEHWAEQAQSRLAELHDMTRRLANAQIEAEMLRDELAARPVMVAGDDPAEVAELRAELAAAAQANERLSSQLEGLTAEWQQQSERLMNLSLENDRLREAAGEERVMIVPKAKEPKNPKRNRSKERDPIIRNCRACKAEFPVSFKNRHYCGEACAPPVWKPVQSQPPKNNDKRKAM